VILFLVLTAPVRAAAPTYPFDLRDVEIALHVRRALLEDPDLANLNLGVSVHHGAATVWGTAPSWELAERALQIAEKVKGVYGVRSDLRVAGNQVEKDAQELKSGLASAGVGLDLTPLMEEPSDRVSSQAGVLDHPPGDPPPQQIFNARPSFPADVATSGSLVGPESTRLTSEPLVATGGVRLLAPVPVTPASFSGPGVLLLKPEPALVHAESASPNLTAAVEVLAPGRGSLPSSQSRGPRGRGHPQRLGGGFRAPDRAGPVHRASPGRPECRSACGANRAIASSPLAAWRFVPPSRKRQLSGGKTGRGDFNRSSSPRSLATSSRRPLTGQCQRD